MGVMKVTKKQLKNLVTEALNEESGDIDLTSALNKHRFAMAKGMRTRYAAVDKQFAEIKALLNSIVEELSELEASQAEGEPSAKKSTRLKSRNNA